MGDALHRQLRSVDLSWLALWGALACASSPAGGDPDVSLPPPTPGYPEHTSSLRLSIDRTQAKQCHATLIAPEWVITAAHCFSGVHPDGRGRLRELDRGFAVADVHFHPLAHVSGSGTLDRVWQDEEFTAAHDLALIPIERVESPSARALWSDAPGCAAIDLRDLPAYLGRLTQFGEPQTAPGVVLGERNASSLLGPGQPGDLLVVRSIGALPGDSGSGVAARADDLAEGAMGCVLGDDSTADVLLGVLQDANPFDARAPLGVTPLYLSEHATWIAEIMQSWTPRPGNDEPPVPEFCVEQYTGCD